MSALEERRQRAREAGHDAAVVDPHSFNTRVDVVRAIDVAIETATRVQITSELIERYGPSRFDPDGHAARRVICEVLEACGFEVEA